jgi:hypothetical protein
MPPADPAPETTTDQLLAQVRDELRSLPERLAATLGGPPPAPGDPNEVDGR